MSPEAAEKKLRDLAALAGEAVVVGEAAGTDRKALQRLIKAMDRALEEHPDHPDILLARSSALCGLERWDEAQDLVEQVLEDDPHHFEARRRKEAWVHWDHVFMYPPWSETAKFLPAQLVDEAHAGREVHLVRDRLRPEIAVVQTVDDSGWGDAFAPDAAFRWEPRLVETPHGPVLAHYTLIRTVSGRLYRKEAFLPLVAPPRPEPRSGYWLLQRLAHARSAFVVVARQGEALFNRRWVFPERERLRLRVWAAKLRQYPVRMDHAGFRDACAWQQRRVDLTRMKL